MQNVWRGLVWPSTIPVQTNGRQYEVPTLLKISQMSLPKLTLMCQTCTKQIYTKDECISESNNQENPSAVIETCHGCCFLRAAMASANCHSSSSVEGQ